jgi:quercetin dioxygenase-like cupin family protein
METPKKFFVQEAELPWESWEEESLRQISPIAWKTFFTQEKSGSSGLVMGLCEILPNRRLIRHYHAQAEVYYLLAGEGAMEIDGVTQQISAGTAVFIPGNAEHAITNTGHEPLRFIYVFPADTFEQIHYIFLEGPTAQ